MPKAKYKKGKDGYYSTKVWDGTYDSKGNKHRITLRSSNSSADLERLVNDMRDKIKNGLFSVPTDITLLKYALNWVELNHSHSEKATKNMYIQCIKNHFATLDGLLLRDVRHSHLQYLINENWDHPRTCQIIFMTFREVMSYAFRPDHFITQNVYNDIMEKVKMPKCKPEERKTLTEQEIHFFLETDLSTEDHIFVLILYAFGLRPGETLALKKSNFDFKKKVLTISESIGFDENTPYTKAPKNDHGFRTLEIPSFCIEEIESYVNSLDRFLLFAQKDGSERSKSSYTKMWQRIIKKVNAFAGGTENLKIIHDITAYNFRHTYCTMLCYQALNGKITIKQIAKMMGNTPAMVNNVYSHIVEEKENISEAVNSAFNIWDKNGTMSVPKTGNGTKVGQQFPQNSPNFAKSV